MSFDLSILIPENSWSEREKLVIELQGILNNFALIEHSSFPSLMSNEHIIYMLEKVMFPYYPTVKDQYLAFCKQNDFVSEPLSNTVAKAFWNLMTARELASIQLQSNLTDTLVQSFYRALIEFSERHKLSIFNSQTGEIEKTEGNQKYPTSWEEE